MQTRPQSSYSNNTVDDEFPSSSPQHYPNGSEPFFIIVLETPLSKKDRCPIFFQPTPVCTSTELRKICPEPSDAEVSSQDRQHLIDTSIGDPEWYKHHRHRSVGDNGGSLLFAHLRLSPSWLRREFTPRRGSPAKSRST
jgi:hypothetical protein